MRALLVLHLHADHCCAMMPGRENNRGTFDFVSAVRRYFFTPNSQAQRALHTVLHVYRLPSVRGVFFSTPGPSFFLRTCPARPIRAHTCSAITRRLCGWLGASVAQGWRALRLWQSSRQWHAVPWSCMDAAPERRLQRRSSVNN